MVHLTRASHRVSPRCISTNNWPQLEWFCPHKVPRQQTGFESTESWSPRKWGDWSSPLVGGTSCWRSVSECGEPSAGAPPSGRWSCPSCSPLPPGPSGWSWWWWPCLSPSPSTRSTLSCCWSSQSPGPSPADLSLLRPTSPPSRALALVLWLDPAWSHTWSLLELAGRWSDLNTHLSSQEILYSALTLLPSSCWGLGGFGHAVPVWVGVTVHNSIVQI